MSTAVVSLSFAMSVALGCTSPALVPEPPYVAAGEAALVTDPVDQQTLAQGREHTRLFFEAEDETLWSHLAPEMAQAFGSQKTLPVFRAQVAAQLGTEAELLGERTSQVGSMRLYHRSARFDAFVGSIQVLWAFDDQGRVAAFSIAPQPEEAPSKHLEYLTRASLRLPFDGDWHVFWGGRTLDVNYHAAYPDQRFAYDFLMMVDGVSHDGDGLRNEDYHCFGVPVLAPAAGEVVAAADDVPDNVPGEMNAGQPLGNHVILDHGRGEYSIMAHFKRGSVELAAGDRVEAGQRLGLCGNSGNSSEAHLHYHLQTTATPFGGQGLPPQFESYQADGRWVLRGEPIKGETIRHVAASQRPRQVYDDAAEGGEQEP